MYTNEQLIAIVDRSKEAEKAKAFLLSNDYVLSVIDRIKTEALAGIIRTPIEDVEAYKALRYKVEYADFFLRMIEDDISAGRAAVEMMSGSYVEGGIL
jgi:hypothetical protein